MSATSVTFDILARDRASQAFKNVGQASDGLHSKFGHLAKGAALLAGGAVAGFGAMAFAGVSMGIKTASSMEQAQIAFSTLLKSGDKAKTFLGDLSKFAAATPFELPGLIDASRQLLGAGASAKSVIPTLTAFGDASGALGLSQDNFSHIMRATTQAMAAGKLQAGDLLQITEAGLPVWKLLSEALHKPVSAVREMSSQGKLLTADVLPKLQKQMEKDYGGAMAKQSQTVSGLWSTFMDTLNQGLAKVLMPLLPVLRDLIPKAAAGMGKAFGGITTVMQKVGPVVAKLVRDGFTKMLPAIATVSGVISQHLVPAFQALAGFVQANILPILRAVAEFVINKLYPALGKILGGALDGLRMAFQHISATVAAHREQLVTLGHFLQKVAEIALKVLAPVLKVGLKTAFRILGTAISLTITIIADAVSVIRGIINAGAAVVGWVRSHWKLITTLLAGPFALAVAAISRHIGAIVGFVKSIPAKVKAVFSNAKDWLLSAGSDVIWGFIHGIEGMAGNLINAIKSTITDKLPGFVKKALGISSPSKVFAAIGVNVMEGLIGGLTKGQGALKTVLQGLVSTFRDTMRSITSSLVGYGDISGAGESGVGIPAFLRAKANDMRRFARLFHRLAARGLSPALLAQFAAIGPPAIGSMQELLGARGAIRDANVQERRLQKFSSQVGRDVASIQLAHSLDTLPKRIARELAKELHHAPIQVHTDGGNGTVHRRRRGG